MLHLINERVHHWKSLKMIENPCNYFSPFLRGIPLLSYLASYVATPDKMLDRDVDRKINTI